MALIDPRCLNMRRQSAGFNKFNCSISVAVQPGSNMPAAPITILIGSQVEENLVNLDKVFVRSPRIMHIPPRHSQPAWTKISQPHFIAGKFLADFPLNRAPRQEYDDHLHP